ncbi:MAG: hypothetical protein QXY45_03225 [Candidatus Aenigmatarchaeota archaeon]
MAKKDLNKVGKWAFIVGILLAVVAGLLPGLMSESTISFLLVVLGIIVGFMNVQEKEVFNFLIAAIAMMAINPVALEAIKLFGIGEVLSSMVTYIAVFVGPAALVVALKAVFDLAKD